MASVASASPSGQSFLCANSSEDTDSWQYADANSPAIGYFPSPTSSLNGWSIVGYANYLGTSSTGMSPLPPSTSQPNQQAPVNNMARDVGNQLLAFPDDQQFVADHDLWVSQLLGDTVNSASLREGLQDDSMGDMPSFEGMDLQVQCAGLNIPVQFQDDGNVAPWAPTNLQYEDNFVFFGMEDDGGAQMSRTASGESGGASSHHSGSPSMPSSLKSKNARGSDPIKKVRGGGGGGGRVEKKKYKNKLPSATAAVATTVDNFVVVTPSSIHQQSGKPNLFECFEAARGVQRGRKGPLASEAAESALNIRRMGACFCCHSRKVKCDEKRPCKNCEKISTHAPKVVCWRFSDFMTVLFPSFIRGHLKKDVIARFISDNVMKFYDARSAITKKPFLVELSSGPRFRSTLKLPASLFVPRGAEVLQHWHTGVGGGSGAWAAHQYHCMDLRLRAAVAVGVDPKDGEQREALRRRAREFVHGLADEPRYAEQVTDAFRGTQIPRRVLEVVQCYAQRSRCPLVRRALAVYATHYVLTRQLCLTPDALARLQSLQQTQMEPESEESIFLASSSIGGSGAHSDSLPTTARVLNRQVKAALDDHLVKETDELFATFGAALKLRSRAEWASCFATFLVLCLLFESIEAAADTFVVSETEIALRTRRGSRYNHQHQGNNINGAFIDNGTIDQDEPGSGSGDDFIVRGRALALDVCRDIDNLPFRQIAYRFHATYQTHHAREPGVSGNGSNSGGGLTFNPLVDASWDADLKPEAAELAAEMRALLDGDGWHELDFLAADPILSRVEAHPYPRDVSLDYTGRLLSRFLLSFTDEKYIFDEQY